MKDIFTRILRSAGDWFSRSKAKSAAQRLQETEVERAIEQVVDQVNPRLRAVRGYRRSLYPVVEATMAYAESLAELVPGPMTVDQQSWAQNPTVNTLFGSIDRLRRVLTGSEVRKFVKEHSLGGDCFAVLASMPDVRNQLGMELSGETVQRDVRQTTVSFSDHEVGLVGEDEAAVRRQLAVTAREILVGIAIEDILSRESHIVELEDRLRIVRIKSRAVDATARGTAFVTDGNIAHHKQAETLQARIEALELELAEAKKGMEGLDDYLDRLVEQLENPEEHLTLEQVTVRLDRMNIVREGGDDTDSAEIGFHRVHRSGKPARVVHLIRFPRTELLDYEQRLRELERYLG